MKQSRKLLKFVILAVLTTIFSITLLPPKTAEAASSGYFYYDVYTAENGTWVKQVVASNGTYPDHGPHTDGNWYVKGKAVDDNNPYYDWTRSKSLLLANGGGTNTMKVSYTSSTQMLTVSWYDSDYRMSDKLDFDTYDYRITAVSYNSYTGQSSVDFAQVFPRPSANYGNSYYFTTKYNNYVYYYIERNLKNPVFYHYDKYQVNYSSWSSEQTSWGNSNNFHRLDYWSDVRRNQPAWNGNSYEYSETSTSYLFTLEEGSDTYQAYSSIKPTGWYYYVEYTKYRTRTRTLGQLVQTDLAGLAEQYPVDGLHSDGYWYKRKGPVGTQEWEKYSVRYYWSPTESGWKYSGVNGGFYATGYLELNHDPYTNQYWGKGPRVTTLDYPGRRVYTNINGSWIAYCQGPLNNDGTGYVCYEKYLDTNVRHQVKNNKVETIRAPIGTYPDDGLYDDGYWYKTFHSFPVITVSDPVMNQAYNMNGTLVPTIKVSDASGDRLTVSYYLDGETTPRETKTITNTITPQVVSFSAISTSALTEGKHTLRYKANDDTDSTEVTVDIFVDGSGPVIGPVQYETADTAITIIGSASDSPAGMAAEAYRYSVGANVSNWTNQPTYKRTGLSPNTLYALKFEARDAVGNVSVRETQLYTRAQTPSFQATGTDTSSLSMTFSDHNPATTNIQIMAGNQYVNASGSLSSIPQWLTLTNKKITLRGLQPNSLYSIKAKAKNSDNMETPFSAAIEATTLAEPPATLSFTAEQLSIHVSWPATQNAIRYDIEVDGVIKNAGNSTSYQHSGLTPNTNHKYRVRVINAGGTSEWSTLHTISTLPYPPPIPSDILTTPSQTQIVVTWNIVAEARGYDLEADGTVIDTGSKTSYILSELKPSTTHIFRVRAKNPGGTSDWSAPVSVNTLPYPPDAPTDLTAEISIRQVAVKWDPVQGADRYEIEADGLILDNEARTTYSHEGLEPLSGHTYRVRSVNAGGKSPWSEALNITTHPEKPDIPTNVMATSEESSIHLTWYEVPHAASYDIEIDGSSIVNVTDNQYIHSNLIPDSRHSYRVRAKNISGDSSWSTPITMASLPNQGDASYSLTNIVAIVTNTSILLSWDSVAPDAFYDVQVDGVFYENNRDTIYHHTGLKANEFHTYKIRIGDESGAGDWVAVLALSTLPNPPDAPANVQTSAAMNAIELRWERVEGATGYELEIDGVRVDVGDAFSYVHEPLASGTAHTYRMRAKNISGVTAWSPAIVESTTTPTYEIRAEKGNIFKLSLLSSNVQDFSELTYVMIYDPNEIEVMDLYDFTPMEDKIGSGTIAGSNLEVTYKPGHIVFRNKQSIVPGTSWSGEITTVEFLSKIDGIVKVDVFAEANR